jgi:EpsI family protein
MSSAPVTRQWMPAVILGVGVGLLSFVRTQIVPELQAPLESALPAEVGGMPGEDVEVPVDEAEVAGFTDYALRVYQNPDSAAASKAQIPWASVYYGFYDQQSRGHTIHSPQNCLPGAGWEAISSEPATIGTGESAFTVNQYILQKGADRALVLYWYQGRGRVAHNEYLVKWDLLRDAATRRRTDEALVRIVVPVYNGADEAAFDLATHVAREVKPALDEVLPS